MSHQKHTAGIILAGGCSTRFGRPKQLLKLRGKYLLEYVLNAALESLELLDLARIAVVSLAKREEEIFLPGRPNPLALGRRDPALHLLQRIRDEAHRFAISYNRKLRSRRTLQSQLAEIPGIGPARQKALLSRFGSVRAVREASPEEIGRVPGLSEALAIRVLTYLKN